MESQIWSEISKYFCQYIVLYYAFRIDRKFDIIIALYEDQKWQEKLKLSKHKIFGDFILKAVALQALFSKTSIMKSEIFL
jgi:hypothetical protein